MRRDSLVLALAALLLAACSGDHDQLAARPKPSSDAGDPIDDAGAPSDDADADELDGGDPPDAATEPPGPLVLTMVNGMPDAPAIRLCFVPVEDGVEAPLAASPLPNKPEGLAYGASMVLTALEGVELSEASLRPYVLSGALPEDEATCAELLAAEREGLVVSPLPVLPAGTFAEGRSALLVTKGCAGGPEKSAPGQDLVCGAGYSPDSPTAGMVLVAMSRSSPGEGIGLQAVHAFATSSALGIEISPGSGLASLVVTPSLAEGTIAPKSAPASYAQSSFGTLPKEASIVVKDAQNSELGRISLGVALDHGGMKAADFTQGRTFTLVGIGPQPTIGEGPWWKAFTFVAVENSPRLPN